MIPVVFPTANRARCARVGPTWNALGYNCITYTDGDFVRYPGYFNGVNQIIREIWDDEWNVVICAADDLYPDPRPAEEILEVYRTRFPDFDGVMQPCGDDLPGTAEICGSPWIGRKFIERAYDGFGPYFPGYRQFYGDEELQNVAQAKGKLWMCLSVTQRHEHWLRGIPKTDYQLANERHWEHDKALFTSRKAAGFPGA